MNKISFSPPDISEKEVQEVINTMKSGWITTGPETKEFERRIAEYCGTEKAVCLNSATAALEGILRVLGIGPGDEVIVPAYTYTASASPVVHVGAKVVFVDTAKNSYEMDYDKVDKAITNKTKAIVAVDIAGVICDYDKLFSITNNKKEVFKANNNIQKAIGRIAIIADAAHAFGASRHRVKAGKIADFTSFSFHAVKNLTTAEGGALLWNNIGGISNNEIYNEFMLYSLHGQSKDALEKMKIGSWEYDIIYPAYKCNMTDIQAAIGNVQLSRYDSLLNRRREIIEMYNSVMDDNGIIRMEHYKEDYNSSGHLYLTRVPNITCEQRNNIIVKMAEQGIATNVHYKPLPMMTAYKSMGYDIEDFPNAYNQYINEITLPLNTCITDDEVRYVLKMYIKAIKEV